MRRVMTVLDAFFDANMQRNENKSEHNWQKSKVFYSILAWNNI